MAAVSTPQQKCKRDKDESPSTPLTPSISARSNEKDIMVNLNNRMAVYVEKVRSLETENSRLKIQITTYEETSHTEAAAVKAMYENELSEARRLLDELSREKAQLQMDNQSYCEKAELERNRANGLAHDNSVLESDLKNTSSLLVAKENHLTALRKEHNDLKADIDGLKNKLTDLQGEYETSQKLVETETIKRVDFENKLQSLKEELQFKEKLHIEEITQMHKRQSISVTEIDQKIKDDYESRLESTIIDLREQQAADIEQMREDLELQYTSKIETLTKSLEEVRAAFASSAEGAKTNQMQLDRLQSQLRAVQAQNQNLSNRAQDLEGKLQTEREMRVQAIIAIEKERDDAKLMLANMEKEYTELLDIKCKLDHEIGVYRKLLEEEEARLHLSPSPMVDGSGSRTRSRVRRKRKRVIVQSTSIHQTTVTDGEGSVKKQKQEELLHESDCEGGPDGGNSCSVM